MMDNPCILVIEDEAPIRTMVRYALEMDHFTVLEAEDAKQAEVVIADAKPHLILLDWMLPKMSGIEFTKRLKQQPHTRNIPIIMLTAKADEQNKVLGLEIGADDYVIKPFSPKELIARIRAVLRRGTADNFSGRLTVRELDVDTASQRVTIAGQPIKLGPLEYRLLCFFIMHPDRVYSRSELLASVWNNDAYVDERTVDVHIRRLRKQLSTHEHDTLVQTVHGSGYRFSEKQHA